MSRDSTIVANPRYEPDYKLTTLFARASRTARLRLNPIFELRGDW